MDDDDLRLDPDFASRFQSVARSPCQLYLISPAAIDDGFADRLRAALDGGPVAAFQLRLKDVPEEAVLRAAEHLLPICRERDVAFILNDRMDLARPCGADGVHLGQATAIRARRAGCSVPPRRSASPSMTAGTWPWTQARPARITWLSGLFSPRPPRMFAPPEPSILSWWSRLFEIPCVAIGGITPDNGGELVAAGADFLAVCNAVWANPDGPADAVRTFQEMLTR
jgi:thiamine-phosphate pyrophosphorylase